MKYLLMATLMSISTQNTFAKEASKTREIKGHVTKFKPYKGHLYWFNLHEFSAPHYADEKFVPCLEKSMTDNKVASLTINNSLVVIRCNVK